LLKLEGLGFSQTELVEVFVDQSAPGSWERRIKLEADASSREKIMLPSLRNEPLSSQLQTGTTLLGILLCL
jgi:hypothetical protein